MKILPVLLALVAIDSVALDQHGISIEIQRKGEVVFSNYFVTDGSLGSISDGRNIGYLSLECKNGAKTYKVQHLFTGFKIVSEISSNVINLNLIEYSVQSKDKEINSIKVDTCTNIKPDSIKNTNSIELDISNNQRFTKKLNDGSKAIIQISSKKI